MPEDLPVGLDGDDREDCGQEQAVKDDTELDSECVKKNTPVVSVPVTFRYPMTTEDEDRIEKLKQLGECVRSRPSDDDISRFFSIISSGTLSSLDNIKTFLNMKRMRNNDDFGYIEEKHTEIVKCFVEDDNDFESLTTTLFGYSTNYCKNFTKQILHPRAESSTFQAIVGFIIDISFFAWFITGEGKENARVSKRTRKLNKLSDRFVYTDKLYCVCRTKSTKGNMIGCKCCNEWYHYKCIGLEVSNPTDLENKPEHFDFYCGASTCDIGLSEYKLVDRTSYEVVWSCMQENIPFNRKESFVETKTRMRNADNNQKRKKLKLLPDPAFISNKKTPVEMPKNPVHTERDFTKSGDVTTKVNKDFNTEKKINLLPDLAVIRSITSPVEVPNNPSISQPNFIPESSDETMRLTPSGLLTSSLTVSDRSCFSSADDQIDGELSIYKDHSYVPEEDTEDKSRFSRYPGAENDDCVSEYLRNATNAATRDVQVDNTLDDDIVPVADLEEIIETKIPTDGIVTSKIENDTFKIDEKDWETWLGMVHNNKFPPRSESGKIWQDIFLSGMKSLNKYCSMCFKDHYVSNQKK